MKTAKTIGIIGFGNMGSACAQAISGCSKNKVLIYDRKKNKTKNRGKAQKAESAKEVILKSQILILAVKPSDFETLINQNQREIRKSSPLLISIIAGTSLAQIEKWLPGVKVVRAMPNLAAKVKKAITFIVAGSLVAKKDLDAIKRLFSSMGEVIAGEEKYIDKITALSGSGPGFIYYFMDSFSKKAQSMGFKKTMAKKIVAATFAGAAELASESGQDFNQLLKSVASAGGTTEAGIHSFEKAKLSQAIDAGIDAAFNKAKKLSSATKKGIKK